MANHERLFSREPIASSSGSSSLASGRSSSSGGASSSQGSDLSLLPRCNVNLVHNPLHIHQQLSELSGQAKFRAAAEHVIEHNRAQGAHPKPSQVCILVQSDSQDGSDLQTPTPSSTTSQTQPAGPQPSLLKRFGRQIGHELYTGGEMVYTWFIPAETGRHWVMFTPCLVLALLVVFTFMAAQYPYYKAYTAVQRCGSNSPSSCYVKAFPTSKYGPNFMLAWFEPATDATTFDFDFMNMWGARYSPSIHAGMWWLWFTWQFVHTGLLHLIGNLVLLTFLAVGLERRFGWYRVLCVWVCAVAGGAFLSAVLENPCTQVLGASAGVFGLVGMYVADLILERQRLQLPFYRLLIIMVFLAIFLATVFTQGNLSNFSHVGGLVCGLLVSFVILPNKRLDLWQRVLPWLGALGVVVWFTVLPPYTYHHVFPRMDCSPFS